MKAGVVAILIVLVRIGLFAQSSDTTLVWPSSPDRPRIRHLQTISSIANLKAEKGFFARIFGFLAGGESTPRWLVQPVGIAVSPVDGRIIVADPGANCIHIIDPVKREYDFIAETKYGKFISPVGVVFTEDGQLYVADAERHAIVRFDREMNAKAEITDSMSRPTGMQIIGRRLFVVDTDQHRIKVFDMSGKFVSSFGRQGTDWSEFNYPVQITGHDSLYVVDALNYRVQEFGLQGNFISSFGRHGNVAGRFASPKGISLDSDGNVYVTDALMDNFQIFNSSGELLLVVGKQGTGNGEFMSPGGITIDRNDRIYVVETFNKRIQIFQYLK